VGRGDADTNSATAGSTSAPSASWKRMLVCRIAFGLKAGSTSARK
jgi:hypothetical protein